ncbi:hypothetical protein EHS43_17945 [Streptomyces sp. RP5T]|nr:hypothetical protein EHS43_17945 [Streptomyces sp. RP5T]
MAWQLQPTVGVWPDVTAGIPEIEDEHASSFDRGSRAYGGHRKSDGAKSLVDTSIRQRRGKSVRRRRSDRSTGAVVTEVQGDGRFPESGETGAGSAMRSGASALLAAQVP